MFALASCLVDLNGVAPEWVQLLPMGEITALDGRKWRLADQAAAEAVVRTSLADRGNTELFVDYDHAIVPVLQHAPNAKAPAAAWVKELQARPDGIYARVDWTTAARTAVETREYRYISPFFTHDQNGTVRQIVNAALTNRPALDMPALAAALTPQTSGVPMDQELLQALGLAADAKPADAVAAASALVSTLASMRSALGLTPNAKPEDIAAKVADLAKVKAATASASAPDPAQFVPRAMFDTLSAQVKAMQDVATTTAAAQAVDAAIAAGKVAPAQKEWAMGYAAKDLPGFQSFAAAAPSLITTTTAASALPPGTATGASGLDEAEAAVCAALGIKSEDYLKTRKGN